MQMLSATREILDLIYKVCGTTYDLIYMDQVAVSVGLSLVPQ